MSDELMEALNEARGEIFRLKTTENATIVERDKEIVRLTESLTQLQEQYNQVAGELAALKESVGRLSETPEPIQQ